MHPLALAALLALGSCVGADRTPEPVAAAEPVAPTSAGDVTSAEAVAIARRFLAAQPYAAQYRADTAEPTERPSSWVVRFEHVNAATRLPTHGAVSVDKRTGSAAWMPGR